MSEKVKVRIEAEKLIRVSTVVEIEKAEFDTYMNIAFDKTMSSHQIDEKLDYEFSDYLNIKRDYQDDDGFKEMYIEEAPDE